MSEFERLYQKAQQGQGLTDQTRIELYEQALALYRGHLLGDSLAREWIVPYNNYYKTLFINCVNNVATLLKNHNRDQEIVQVCEKALAVEKFEETFYLWYLNALLDTGQYSAALKQYEYVSELFFHELGVTPSDAMLEVYQRMHKETSQSQMALDEIQHSLVEQTDQYGAFYCNVEIFRYIYRFISRQSARSGQPAFLVCLSISTLDMQQPSFQQLSEAMEQLREAAIGSLRRVDVVCKWSNSQLLLLLSGLTDENCTMVIGRIHQRFRKQGDRRSLRVLAKVRPVQVKI